jgi:hypothetical protein
VGAPILRTPSEYRQSAAQARELAMSARTYEFKVLLQKIANDYDELARYATELQKRNP